MRQLIAAELRRTPDESPLIRVQDRLQREPKPASLLRTGFLLAAQNKTRDVNPLFSTFSYVNQEKSFFHKLRYRFQKRRIMSCRVTKK